MGTPAIDFQAVNAAALANLFYLQRRIPDSHLEGKRLHADTLHGGRGRSFNMSLETGAWSDQSTGEGGGDPVSLVAAQNGIGQGEAARLIADELGLSSPAPLARKSKDLPEAPVVGCPTKIHPYFNPDGSQAYMVGRWEKEGCRKAIRPGRFDETGAFRQGLNGIEPILYNLVTTVNSPGVIDSAFVVVVEGENKTDTLARLGICATCNTGGAGKWKAEYAEYFKGKAVVILPDNDDAGRKHAEQVAASLHGVAAYVKVAELPGLPLAGDIIDWLEVPGNDKERLQALMNDAPYWKPEPGKETEPRPLSVDWTAYRGVSYLTAYPEPFEYLLKGAFLKGELGTLSGPPGAGKGTLALQMAAYMAAGMPVFDWWEVPEPIKVLYISAEDSRPVIHRRLHHAILKLPENVRHDAAARIVAIPVRGRVNLCKGERNAGISLTDHLADLKKIISEFKPGLVFLDTLSRFFGVDENDNPAMTAACGVIEEIIKDYGCNV